MSERLIDPDDPEFQLGRYLYEAQVLCSEVETGKQIDPERVKEVCERYCRLISLTGMLRSECFRLEGIIQGTRKKSWNLYEMLGRE